MNLSKSRFKLQRCRGIHTCSNKVLGFRDVIESNQKGFCGSGSNWGGQPRVLLNGCRVGGYDLRFSRLVSKVASDFRNHSTSVDSQSHVNDISWEKIYIQRGLDVKKVLDYSHPNVKTESLNSVLDEESRESEIEKEAWKLLKGSIVNYCGTPVGTVAATDPADKLPLNYDQVFIRDFVPSSLAFLLNGEGEIVKNFLLHTLHLQPYCGWPS